MNDCKQFESMIRDQIAGKLDEGNLGTLLAHCRNCEDCRQLMRLHQEMTDLGAAAPEPEQRP